MLEANMVSVMELYTDMCWCITQSRKEACFAPEMTIFQVFFLDVCTTHRGNHGFRRFFVQLIAETMTLLVALYNSIAEIPLAKTKVHQTGRQPRQYLQNDRNIRLFIRDPLSFLVLVSNRTGNFYYYCMIQIR